MPCRCLSAFRRGGLAIGLGNPSMLSEQKTKHWTTPHTGLNVLSVRFSVRFSVRTPFRPHPGQGKATCRPRREGLARRRRPTSQPISIKMVPPTMTGLNRSETSPSISLTTYR